MSDLFEIKKIMDLPELSYIVLRRGLTLSDITFIPQDNVINYFLEQPWKIEKYELHGEKFRVIIRVDLSENNKKQLEDFEDTLKHDKPLDTSSFLCKCVTEKKDLTTLLNKESHKFIINPAIRKLNYELKIRLKKRKTKTIKNFISKMNWLREEFNPNPWKSSKVFIKKFKESFPEYAVFVKEAKRKYASLDKKIQKLEQEKYKEEKEIVSFLNKMAQDILKEHTSDARIKSKEHFKYL